MGVSCDLEKYVFLEYFRGKEINVVVSFRRYKLRSKCKDGSPPLAVNSKLTSSISYFHIKLAWVPRHSGVGGNCIAHELAKKGTLTQIPSGSE